MAEQRPLWRTQEVPHADPKPVNATVAIKKYLMPDNSLNEVKAELAKLSEAEKKELGELCAAALAEEKKES